MWDPSRKAKYLAFIDLDQLTFPLLHCRKLHVSLKLEEEFASYGGWKAVEREKEKCVKAKNTECDIGRCNVLSRSFHHVLTRTKFNVKVRPSIWASNKPVRVPSALLRLRQLQRYIMKYAPLLEQLVHQVLKAQLVAVLLQKRAHYSCCSAGSFKQRLLTAVHDVELVFVH